MKKFYFNCVQLLARKTYMLVCSNHAMYVLCTKSTVCLCVATMLCMYYVLNLYCVVVCSNHAMYVLCTKSAPGGEKLIIYL